MGGPRRDTHPRLNSTCMVRAKNVAGPYRPPRDRRGLTQQIAPRLRDARHRIKSVVLGCPMHYRWERYVTAAVSALAVAILLSLEAILIRDVDATETAATTTRSSTPGKCNVDLAFNARLAKRWAVLTVSNPNACAFSHGSEIGLRGPVQ
jgi:hypothetical protein